MTARMDDTAGIVFTPPRGVKPKPPRFAGKHFLKPQSEGAPTTTRQAEVLNTAIIGSPGDNRGVVIGTDQLSGAMVAHDPFTAYEGHRITSPNVCLIGGLGSGKALDVDTLIPTPQGFVRIGDIEVGDYVFDETGNPTRVVAVSDVMTGRECLAVRFSDGSVIVADAQHLWKTVTRSNRNKRSPYGGPITTSRISETMMAGQQTNHAVALTRPLSLPDADLLIDPYTLGAWLGDGSSSSGTITTPDREVLANIEDAGYLTTFRGRYAHTITIPKDHGPHHDLRRHRCFAGNARPRRQDGGRCAGL